MWVYQRQIGEQLWTVGFHSPSGSWYADSDHDTKAGAADRCAYLNGRPQSQVVRDAPDPSRFMIAAMVMQGYIASHTGDGPPPEHGHAAKQALKYADALIAAANQ
jgi:hypothetical protein